MIVVENRASAILYNFLLNYNGASGKTFIIPANVCPIVPATFILAGINFEIVDIDENTHALNLEEVLSLVFSNKKKYGGVLFVHSYGKEFDIAEFFSSLKEMDNSFCTISDKCLCKPSVDDGLMIDSCDLELFSTGYSKYVELGFGGYAFVGKNTFYQKEKSKLFLEQSYDELLKYFKKCLSGDMKYQQLSDNWLDNEKITFEPSLLTSSILMKIEEVSNHKDKINRVYMDNLPDKIILGADYNDWRFMLYLNNRDLVLSKIFENNLFAGSNFPSVSMMYGGRCCVNAERGGNKLMNLFNDFRVDEHVAYAICKVINANI